MRSVCLQFVSLLDLETTALLGETIEQSELKTLLLGTNACRCSGDHLPVAKVRSSVGWMFLLTLHYKQKFTGLRSKVGTQNELLNCFCVRQVVEQTIASFGWNHGLWCLAEKRRNQTLPLERCLGIWMVSVL